MQLCSKLASSLTAFNLTSADIILNHSEDVALKPFLLINQLGLVIPHSLISCVNVLGNPRAVVE